MKSLIVAGRNPNVIEAVDGNQLRDMADLFDVSQHLDVGDAILLDILRWGQPMTLVMPAAYTVPQAMAPMQPQPMPPMPPAAMPQGGTPIPAAQTPAAQPMAAPVGAAAAAGTGPYVCPRSGLGWSQQAVHPHYRCPRCGGPLMGANAP